MYIFNYGMVIASLRTVTPQRDTQMGMMNPATKAVLFLGITMMLPTVCASTVVNTFSSDDSSVILTETYEAGIFGEYKIENNNSADIHFVFVGNNDGSSPDATLLYADWAATTIAKSSGLPSTMSFNSTSLTWGASWDTYFPSSDSIFAFYRSDSSSSVIAGGGGIANAFGWSAPLSGSDFATDFVVFGSGGTVIAQSQTTLPVAEPGYVMVLGIGLLAFGRRRFRNVISNSQR
jgi:hypothetical protein